MSLAATLSTLLAALGLAWVALSLRRHSAALPGATSAALMRLRAAGATVATAAPLPWVLTTDWAQALVTWSFCLLPLAGLGVALALAYAPEVVARVSGAVRLASSPFPERKGRNQAS